MKDRISALMDGELDEREAAETIDTLVNDAQARDAWRAYHLLSFCVSSNGFNCSEIASRAR